MYILKNGVQVIGLTDVWELIKSVYMNGKFQTTWKQNSLTGWYDEISENVYLGRTLVSRPSMNILSLYKIELFYRIITCKNHF